MFLFVKTKGQFPGDRSVRVRWRISSDILVSILPRVQDVGKAKWARAQSDSLLSVSLSRQGSPDQISPPFTFWLLLLHLCRPVPSSLHRAGPSFSGALSLAELINDAHYATNSIWSHWLRPSSSPLVPLTFATPFPPHDSILFLVSTHLFHESPGIAKQCDLFNLILL